MNSDRVLNTCLVESEELSDSELAHVVGGKGQSPAPTPRPNPSPTPSPRPSVPPGVDPRTVA